MTECVKYIYFTYRFTPLGHRKFPPKKKLRAYVFNGRRSVINPMPTDYKASFGFYNPSLTRTSLATLNDHIVPELNSDVMNCNPMKQCALTSSPGPSLRF